MWLLWLALLIPVAQTLATSHALSHSQLETIGEGGNKGLHTTLCGLCLSATSLSNAAPAGSPLLLPEWIARHEAPPVNSNRVAFSVTARAYESRAPPFLLH